MVAALRSVQDKPACGGSSGRRLLGERTGSQPGPWPASAYLPAGHMHAPWRFVHEVTLAFRRVLGFTEDFT